MNSDKAFMKTQKYISILAALMIHFSFGCSTHPEIKPYQTDNQELAIDENQQASNNSVELPDDADGFVEDAELSEDMEKSEVVAEGKESTPLPVVAQQEPQKKEVKKVETKVSKKMVTSRTPASTLKNGFFVFAESCDMKSSPKSGSKSVGNVSKGKKLWLDVHNSSWLKAYKKSGTAYVSSDCVK